MLVPAVARGYGHPSTISTSIIKEGLSITQWQGGVKRMPLLSFRPSLARLEQQSR